MFRFLRYAFSQAGLRGFFSVVLHLPAYFNLFRGLLGDDRVPIYAKAMLGGAAVYTLSPLNFLNFIPVIGEMDDVAMLWMAGRWFLQLCPQHVVREHQVRCGLGQPDHARP